MTTNRQMQKLFAPLLAAFPDLVCIGRDLVFTPVRHVAAGILTDRTPSKEDFVVYAYVQLLFVKYEHPLFTHYHEIFPQRTVRRWNLDDPEERHEYFRLWNRGNPETSPNWLIDDARRTEEFTDVMRDDILPHQQERTTLEAGCEYWRRAYSKERTIADSMCHGQITMIAIALGDFDEAAERLRAGRGRWLGQSDLPAEFNREVPGLGDRIMEQGNALDDGDRAALAGLLRKWEEHTVTHLQLKKHWQPSPFPFEEALHPDAMSSSSSK